MNNQRSMDSVRIIGLLAKKRHGKDTAAIYLNDKYGYTVDHFGDNLKEVCRYLFGLNDEQLYGNEKDDEITGHVIKGINGLTPRKLFQGLGTFVVRGGYMKDSFGIGDEHWIKLLMDRIGDTKTVIADVRFQNEVDSIKSKGGIIVKIIRPNVDDCDEHESEAGIDDIEGFDFVIINDGTIEEFYDKIDKLLFYGGD